MKKLAALLALLITINACNSAPEQNTENLPTYKVGYMICNSEKETIQRFGAFNAYLGKALNANFEMAAIDTTQFMNEVDTLHFTHTNSLLYIMLNRFNGVEILATEKKDSLGSKSQGVFIVRNDSDIKTIDDLRNRSVIFGPTLAPTGFMSQIDLLQKNNIDPESDLAFYTIPRGSFKHEKVVYGVLFERYDAGALPIGDIENMIADNRIAEDDFRVIAEAEPILYCNFAVTQKVDGKLAQKFKEALLALTPETTVEFNGEVVRVLERALADGYEDVSNDEFDSVREMAKRTNMPPYQKF